MIELKVDLACLGRGKRVEPRTFVLSDIRELAVGSREVRRTLADGLSRSVVVARGAILTRIALARARR